jgi:hypothetical protein
MRHIMLEAMNTDAVVFDVGELATNWDEYAIHESHEARFVR